MENRLEVYQKFKSIGIETRPLVAGNIGRQPFCIKEYSESILKNADVVHNYGIYLPNHHELCFNEIKYVVDEFRKIAEPVFFDE